MKLQGVIGKGSGKLGNTVWAVNSGVQIMREYVKEVRNPNTALQVAQRARLKLGSQLAATFASVSLFPKEGLRTSRNVFMKKNMPVIFADDTRAYVHYEDIQLTSSNLAFPSVMASYVGGVAVHVALSSDISASVSRVCYIVYAKAENEKLMLLGSHIVTEASADGTFPVDLPFSSAELVIYAYGMKDKNVDATAFYSSYNLDNGEALARLVCNRTLTSSDFTFTRSSATTLYKTPDVMPYGIEFDSASSSPTCKRIGATELHRTLPVQSLMRGCLLDDNGDVVEYLPANDWRGSTRDGSSGQVMVEIPAYYRKFVTIGTKHQVWISLVPQTGYEFVPRCYVSAYEAALDRDNNKLASVVNNTAQYRGGNNTSAWDGTYRSLLGRPATNISLTDFRDYARARKADSAEWNCMTYDVQKSLYWLFVVEYATLNSQAEYNANLTEDGLKQGGLGAGVTNLNSTMWASFNSSNPFVLCGYTDDFGNNTGVKFYGLPDEYDPGNHPEVSVPRYRGIENPFGHINKRTDGILVQVHPVAGENVSKVFVCFDPAKFSSTVVTDYTHVGNLARTSGFIEKVLFGEGGEILAEVVGGSGSTNFCDYNYTSMPDATELFSVLFGGVASGGLRAGFACAYSSYTPLSGAPTFGSRLTFIPSLT